MEEDATLVTREQYLEMLVDASCWDASEMESGFMLFDALENLTKDELAALMGAHGKQLRAAFTARHGYRPEDSTTPYVPNLYRE